MANKQVQENEWDWPCKPIIVRKFVALVIKLKKRFFFLWINSTTILGLQRNAKSAFAQMELSHASFKNAAQKIHLDARR